MLEIEKFLEKHYTLDEPIILACSTGPDSMFLLYHILNTKYAKNLVACYFNHKIRPESEKEELFLENLGKEKGFKVEIAEANIIKIQATLYPNKGIEELAREKRYAFFNALLNIYPTTKVITGHHLDDKIETFFFHLARGSKITGLINMTEKSGGVLRPLLHLEKPQITQYLDNNNLQYFIDSTNIDTSLTRNKLRHDILPEFININSNYKQHINNFSNYLEEVKEHLDRQVTSFLEEQGILIFNSQKYKINTLEINGYFYITDYQKLSSLIQKELIRHIYYISNNKSTIGLSESNISEVIRFIGGKNNKTIKEIQQLKMKKENTIIIF